MTTFAGGVGHLARGFGMWRRRPGLMLLGMVPALIVFLLLLAAFLLLLWKVDDLVDWATPFADEWATTARTVLRVGLMLAVLTAALFLSAAVFVALTLAVGDPFYERIWRATEGMLGGPVPDRGVGVLRSVGDSVAFAGVSLVCRGRGAAGGVPARGRPDPGGRGGPGGVGPAARLELLARPLEARGLDRAARKALLRRNRGGMLGFGVATQAFFLIPLGAVLVMPAAVVGATGLARDLLADRRSRHPADRHSRDGQRPLSVYVGPASSEVEARAASTRRAVKSAQRSRAWSSVQNSASRISRASRTISSVISGVVDPAVEDQAERVVPAAPRRQPVGEQQPARGDRQPELLGDLPRHGELGRLADLDHAAGQVPVLLVGEAAEQHPVVAVAHQHLADRPLARQEGVEQRPETRPARAPGCRCAAGRNTTRSTSTTAHHALTPHPGPGGHAQRLVVVGGDVRLHPAVLGQCLLHVPAYRVDGEPQSTAMSLESHEIRATPSATVLTGSLRRSRGPAYAAVERVRPVLSGVQQRPPEEGHVQRHPDLRVVEVAAQDPLRLAQPVVERGPGEVQARRPQRPWTRGAAAAPTPRRAGRCRAARRGRAAGCSSRSTYARSRLVGAEHHQQPAQVGVLEPVHQPGLRVAHRGRARAATRAG